MVRCSGPKPHEHRGWQVAGTKMPLSRSAGVPPTLWTAGFRASGQAGAILLEEVQRR